MNAARLSIRGSWYRLWLFAALSVVCSGVPTIAQTLSTIRTNGPLSNRINIVILSEGYTSPQLGTFLRDATNAFNSMMASPPYQEYSNYFNAFAISVASAQSGSDHHTPSTTLVNTYFNSTFDSYQIQRLLTIPPNDWDSTYNDGQGKVDALLQSLMPQYDIVVLVVNDTTYGGSGGTSLITSVNASSPEIVVHESGHSFAGLADEYSSAYPGWIPVEYPNATAQTNRASIRWTSWILGTTPLPTPGTAPYTSLVGLFLGAEYQTTGWYRPKFNCKMNALGIPFCEICSEQLVKSTYQTIRSIDSSVPAASSLSVTGNQAVAFSVSPLQPATHALSIQWYTNGTAVPSATNTSFNLSPQLLPRGTNLVRVSVRDTTALVRNDPSNVLSNSASWTLNVVSSQLRLVNPKWLPGGSFSFVVTGAAPNGFVIQTSTNFSNWLPLSTNALAGGQLNYTNFGVGSIPRRFFRAVITP